MTVGEDDGLVGSGSVDLAIRLGFLALVGKCILGKAALRADIQGS